MDTPVYTPTTIAKYLRCKQCGRILQAYEYPAGVVPYQSVKLSVQCRHCRDDDGKHLLTIRLLST